MGIIRSGDIFYKPQDFSNYKSVQVYNDVQTIQPEKAPEVIVDAGLSPICQFQRDVFDSGGAVTENASTQTTVFTVTDQIQITNFSIIERHSGTTVDILLGYFQILRNSVAVYNVGLGADSSPGNDGSMHENFAPNQFFLSPGDVITFVTYRAVTAVSWHFETTFSYIFVE